jgi:hypothetical protein
MHKVRHILLFLSPVLFIVDFLFLISLKEPVNPLVKNTGLLILLFCILAFIGSLILTVISLIGKVVEWSEVNKLPPGTIYPTRLESVIRKVLAVLIVATAIPGVMIGLLFVPLAVIIGLYVFLRKRYLFLFDIFILLIGALLYFQGLPLFGPDARSLKLFILGVTGSPFVVVFLLSKILIFAAGLILTASGFLSRLSIFINSPKRDLMILFIAVVSTGSLITAPLLQPFRLYPGGEVGQFGENCPPEKYAFPEGTMKLTVDTQNRMWVYHFNAKNILKEKVSIQKITGKKPRPKLLGFLQLSSEEVLIAPPFGQQIIVTGAQKSTTGVTAEPGVTLDMQIASYDPLYGLVITIGDNWCSLAYGFLGPGEDVEEITETLDPNVQFITNAERIPSGPPQEQTTFSSGETVYPRVTGLKKGITYGFQIINSQKQAVIPFDQDRACTNEAREGSTVGCGEFNNETQPLNPGKYEVQLIKVEAEKGFIIAKTQVTITP